MSTKTLKINEIIIGENRWTLVIPEIGINHNGSLSIAKEMVYSAYRAGARLIKHQTHIVSDEMSPAAKGVIPGNANISIYDIMEGCALTEEDELELIHYTKSLGMVFLSTPFSRAAADRLERFGVPAYKIGSGEMNNYPLLEHVASFGKPMIVSTGMNDIASIHKAVTILERYGVEYALMHTTNIYPTAPHLIRLGAMQTMMKEFPHIPIGLSDHSLNNNACIAAMAMGATLVERHFTDTMERTGPDIVCSMDEARLKELLLAAREVPQMLGGTKHPLREEQPTIDFAFATVVTLAPIRKGELFTAENLWIKRPGSGEIPAESYDQIINQTASCNIPADIHLNYSMISK